MVFSCMEYCPTHSTAWEGECSSPSESAISTVLFNKVATYDYAASPYGMFQGGANPGVREPDDPLTYGYRGLWFDGIDNFITYTDVILNS